MPRILITSARQAGFVLPLLQIAQALVARGDEVTFLTGSEFAPRVDAVGARFARLPYDDVAPPAAVRPARNRNGVREVARLLEALFLDPIEVDHRTVLSLSASLGVDAVISEPLFVGSSIIGLLPRGERPAVLSIGFFPLPFSSSDTPPFGLGLAPIDEPLNTVRNGLLRLGTDIAVLGGLRRRFAEEVRRLTGATVRGSLFDIALSPDAFAQTTVPQFEFPHRDLSPKVRFVGPLPPPPLGELPAWWDYGDRTPIVHVTQGTYANADPTELIVPTIRALADVPVRVVATTGGPDPATVSAAYGGPLPANARVERFLPYDHLLAASSVVVTNGGYGTVHHALRWGVPLVVSGTTEDKVEVNARVAWAGVGINLKQQRPQPEAIRQAVTAVLADPQHRRSATRIASAIAATDPVRDLLALVDEVIAANRPGGPGAGASALPRLR
ncbi:MAG TPA: nucleotide disphospho-sugar-binding domain-containing protein [Amnibacterium sp.]|nr:nucleotide disphospho-sugar-binding domain-containing protein [Amnibacterium sp.]